MRFPGKRPIRVGDTTTHGGTVLPVSHKFAIAGKSVVVKGDEVMCPRCGLTTITQGDAEWPLGGALVALHSYGTSCGATLISSLPS